MANQKKALMISTVPSTIGQFNMENIKLLRDLGYETSVTANFDDRSVWDAERTDRFVKELDEKGVNHRSISFSRNPLNLGKLFASLGELRKYVESEKFDIVHCHTPVAAMCTRISCRKLRKNGTKVIYTAHGFHFFKGAPIKNWLIYYPIERLCSCWTDVIITINQEDFLLAKKRMKAKKVEWIPGVGIDVKRFTDTMVDRAEKRREIGVPEDAILVLSVGELNKNKNHETIIRAIAETGAYYFIAGKGESDTYLQSVIDNLGLADRVKLLGYRSDIVELCKCADIFAFPSFREGLGLAALEAMACGLPLVTSNVHGINDYSENGVTGYKCSPSDVDAFKAAIEKLIDSPELRMEMGKNNVEAVKKYDSSNIAPLMTTIYSYASAKN